VFEWYWKQPGVAHVAEFVDAIRKKTGKVPTARTWFGYAATWSCALAANAAKSLDAVKMAKALSGMTLPAEVGLMPFLPTYRVGQNQSLNTLYVGHAQAGGSDPEDLFNVTDLVKGKEAAGTLEETGCKMSWPT
jgi:branched-chain amino acid transport system substrate-binding protein